MASQPETTRMRNRGLLTKGDRKLLRGERDVEDREKKLSDLRWRVRQRIDRIETDLEILREAGEDDLVNEFRDRFARDKELERRIERLEDKLEDE